MGKGEKGIKKWKEKKKNDKNKEMIREGGMSRIWGKWWGSGVGWNWKEKEYVHHQK